MAFAQTPARLKILIPGYPQWAWRQSERAAALVGTYIAAMAVTVFAWGSRAGLAMLGLAFLAHVVSAADAIKQSAFPGFGRWIPATSASVGLGLGCYAPLLALATALAWPESPSGSTQDQFAINLWAFRAAEPTPGDWVWYRSPDSNGFGLGRVVAGQGKSVEWTPGGLSVNGRPLPWMPGAPGGSPLDLAMIVPDGEILVAPVRMGSGRPPSCGLNLVAREGVVGRPWARLYPIWRRGLLL